VNEPVAREAPQPLAKITSIKVKLGLLVAVSVAVAAIIATVGAKGGVPALLGVPVTIALALGVTQLLAVGMTSPLRAMTAAARQMAAGNYSAPIVTTSRDEIGELSAAFNLMARDLAEVDRERRELIANVSHELRTPLAALSARLENLADGVEVADRAAMGQALGQTKRLSTLVSDLLDLSRLDAGLTELSVCEIPVQDFLMAALEDLSSLGREVRFSVHVEPASLTVQGDPVRLRQLVTNLLANAARHSPGDGVVQVHCSVVTPPSRPPASWWRLEITDSGPGIPAADRERVFERFGTLAGHEGGGTGLGLAIARWVSVLHGGTVRFVDPVETSGPSSGPPITGARVRVELPREIVDSGDATEVGDVVPGSPGAPIFTTGQVRERESPAIGGTPSSVTAPLPDVWDGFWPEAGLAPRRDLLLVSAAVGLLAAVAVPFGQIGVGMFVVLVSAGATVLFASPHRRERYTLVSAALALMLTTPAVIRDADWIVVLCLLAGVLIMTVSVTRAGTVTGFVLAVVSWPLAGIRGLPWLAESINSIGGRTRARPAIRTLAWSVVAVGVFGLLFASADPVLATWLRTLLPEWSFTRLVLRGFLAVAVGAGVLAATYLALNPPRVDNFGGWVTDTPDGTIARWSQFRYEWLAPVLLINGVFVAFLTAQATVFFGGHDYLRRTTGLTYADYVHQGFGQLTIATGLTLVVVWAAVRKAGRRTAQDLLWLRGSLGLLCALTMVVVASAMYRLQVYQDAYGFTRLRLLVGLFEGWLGFVVLTVIIAGITLRGSALPRIALFSGAVALVALAFANPDAWIARHNIERYQTSAAIDWVYLDGLSADAAPALAELPAADRACLTRSLKPRERRAWSWNWGYHQARSVAVPEPDLGTHSSCRSVIVSRD
jgi:two-component system, OmpR family, sensor histidine kinase BaeS